MRRKKNKPRLPSRKEDLRAVDRAFIHTVMFELGIVPMEEPSISMNRILENMSPEEARVTKRKFRKLWRKYLKENSKKTNKKYAEVRLHTLEKMCGQGKNRPSRSEFLERKKLVLAHIWNTKIAPLVSEFENPQIHNEEAE